MISKTKKAILYTRVSTVEQDEGASLRYQEEQLRNYCKNLNYEIVGCYTDKESGRDFDRKDFARLHAYVKQNKGNVDFILVTRWDRFGRNQYLTVKAKSDFKKLGVTVKAIEQNVNLDETIPEYKLIENIQYTLDEIESDKISIRVKASNYKFAKEGAFLNKAPKGYAKTRIDGKSSLTPNEYSKIIQTAFSMFATGNYSTEALRKKMNLENVCKQGFINLLRNRVYAGYVRVPAFKEDSAYWIRGLHEPIIDIPLFDKVQTILNGNRLSPIKALKKGNEFFLRGHVICPNCLHPFTASRSKGRKQHYAYYHCDSKYGCNQRFTKCDFESKLIDLVGRFEVKKSVEKIYHNILKVIIGDNSRYATRRVNDLKRELDELNESIHSNQDLLVSRKISDVTFNDINNRYELKKQTLEAEIGQAKTQPNGEIATLFDKGVMLVKSLKKVLLLSSAEDRSLIIGSIFPKKLTFWKGEYRTTEINSFILLLCPSIKDFSLLENGQAVNFDGLSTSAPRLGLEPRTLRLTV